MGFCRGNARHGMIEPTRQRPRHRDGLPRAAKICRGRLPRCRATAVLPPSSILAKLRLNARFGVSSPHGRPAARADPRATSPPRWAIPGGQDLRWSSLAFLSYSCFAGERRDAKMRLNARFGVSRTTSAAERRPMRPVRPPLRGRGRKTHAQEHWADPRTTSPVPWAGPGGQDFSAAFPS